MIHRECGVLKTSYEADMAFYPLPIARWAVAVVAVLMFVVRVGFPFWLSLPLGGLMAAAVGAIVGTPSLRIKGLYLAIATLAGQLIIEWTINHVKWISGGVQASIVVPRPQLFGLTIATQ